MPYQTSRPPRLAEWLLHFSLHEVDVDIVLGDLEETYTHLSRRYSRREAKRWYWSQALRSVPLLFSRTSYWSLLMLRNYVKTTLRNFKKHKGYSSINIVGLALGMACCMLLIIHIQYGLSFDRHHEHAEQIYRINSTVEASGQHTSSSWTPLPLAQTLKDEVPEVVAATRLFQRRQENIRIGEQNIDEKLFFTADQTLFDVFSFEIVAGNEASLLTNPNSVVITESFAARHFANRDPIGQTIELGQNLIPFQVTGVIADLPITSHFKFNLLASYNTFVPFSDDWTTNRTTTYVLLQDGYTGADLEPRLTALIDKYLPISTTPFDNVSYATQPLLDIHLHSHYSTEFEPNGSIMHIYIMSIVAAFLMLIACINFMNLSTARASRRAKEVGMRKALGAVRQQLIYQFLGESTAFALFALVVALVFVYLGLPFFNDLVGTVVPFSLAQNLDLLLLFVGLALFAGMLAGMYPAFYLSAFFPSQVLKGKIRQQASASFVRRGLVVFQFAISITLICGATVILQQLQYVQNKDLGFAQEQLMILPFRTLEARNSYEALKDALIQSPLIESVSGTNNPTAGRTDNDNSVLVTAEGTGTDQHLPLVRAGVDFGYIETMDFEITEGRSLSKAFPSDLEQAVVLNETAVEHLGLTDPIGKRIEIVGRQTEMRTVVGVVKDFHQRSLREEIGPIVLQPEETIYLLLARVQADNIAEALAFTEQTFRAFNPTQDFVYRFLDETFAAYYQAEQNLSKTINTFTMLAILIACLGLFGLAAFMAESRTKEIGIRKALGASVGSIIVLLSKRFLILVGLAFVLSAPLAYLVMHRWLADFAYHIDLSWLTFAGAGIMALLIAGLTVSYQAVKAARTNPVTSLRYE